jgi:hypothetical protein
MLTVDKNICIGASEAASKPGTILRVSVGIGIWIGIGFMSVTASGNFFDPDVHRASSATHKFD